MSILANNIHDLKNSNTSSNVFGIYLSILLQSYLYGCQNLINLSESALPTSKEFMMMQVVVKRLTSITILSVLAELLQRDFQIVFLEILTSTNNLSNNIFSNTGPALQ
jgi:hypothetical protein